MKSIFKTLASGALLLATMPGCDLSNWCINAFGSCENANGGEGGSETGLKASGVNVQNCTTENLDPYTGISTGRSFAVWATNENLLANPNPSWIGIGEVGSMVPGQKCPDDGPMVSFQFPVESGSWTVRVIKSGIFGNGSDPVVAANCGSGEPNDPDCASFREDHFYVSDPSAPMDPIVLSKP